MHFVSEASKHAKLNEVEPDIPIRRVVGTEIAKHAFFMHRVFRCRMPHSFFACRIRSLDVSLQFASFTRKLPSSPEVSRIPHKPIYYHQTQ